MKSLSFGILPTSEEIQSAVGDGVYDMSLNLSDAEIVERLVNVGIDAHLETCYMPSRGDTYCYSEGKLRCGVSGKSLAVLLRRLREAWQEGDEEAGSLAGAILETLGFEWV